MQYPGVKSVTVLLKLSFFLFIPHLVLTNLLYPPSSTWVLLDRMFHFAYGLEVGDTHLEPGKQIYKCAYSFGINRQQEAMPLII